MKPRSHTQFCNSIRGACRGIVALDKAYSPPVAIEEKDRPEPTGAIEEALNKMDQARQRARELREILFGDPLQHERENQKAEDVEEVLQLHINILTLDLRGAETMSKKERDLV